MASLRQRRPAIQSDETDVERRKIAINPSLILAKFMNLMFFTTNHGDSAINKLSYAFI